MSEALNAIDKACNSSPECQRVHFIRGQVLQGLDRKEKKPRPNLRSAKKLMDSKG